MHADKSMKMSHEAIDELRGKRVGNRLINEFRDILDKEVETQKDITRNFSISTVMTAHILTLHDKFNFSKDQLQQFVNQATKQLQLVKEQYCSVEDIQGVVNEMGLEGLW